MGGLNSQVLVRVFWCVSLWLFFPIYIYRSAKSQQKLSHNVSHIDLIKTVLFNYRPNNSYMSKHLATTVLRE